MKQAIAIVKTIWATYLIAVRGLVLMLTVGGLSHVYDFAPIGYWQAFGIMWVLTSLASMFSGQDEKDFEDMISEAE